MSMSTIDKRVKAEVADRVESLRRVVTDGRRTAESRRTAAIEILRLVGEDADPDAAEVVTTPAEDIADDDADVLELMRPLTPEDERFFGGTYFGAGLAPKSVEDAKAIVGGRRLIAKELRRVADETLPGSERVAAIEVVLERLDRLARLDCNDEASWERLGHRTAGWLLESAKPVAALDRPLRLRDVWP